MTELGKLFQIFTMRAEKNAFVNSNFRLRDCRSAFGGCRLQRTPAWVSQCLSQTAGDITQFVRGKKSVLHI